jgi:quinoprotein glucose dehydrogenase
MRYSPLDQITKDNVQNLQIAWRWSSREDRALQLSNPILRSGRHQDTPLMANGVLYTMTPLGLVAALDPTTGEARWIYDPASYKSPDGKIAGKPADVGFVTRGVSYWSDGTAERLFIGASDGYLLAIDARTGKPDSKFGVQGRVDVVANIRSAIRGGGGNITLRTPLVAGNVIVVGTAINECCRMPPGDVLAFDARTGKRVWTFHTIPHPGEFGYDTWLNGSGEFAGSANVWASMSYDEELDYIYLPVSTPDSDHYGGARPGDGLFGESIVCLEAKSGKRVWHFQAVHHGLWDYDLPAAPALGDINVDGRPIKALMQISKQGFVYVLDRRTGTPVWPIIERPVPQSTVPGEHTSPTQPFPTKPAAYDLQGSTEENLLNFTPELRQRALQKLNAFVHGPLYTPPSREGTITVPGNWGAGSWGGAAFDPETHVLYVPSRTLVHLQCVVPGSKEEKTDFKLGACTAPAGLATNDAFPLETLEGLSLFKPPYSRVTAIDMNRGEHVWMTPIGNGPRNHPLLRGLNLPPLGDGVRGLALVTKTLLFVNTVRIGITGAPMPPDTGYATQFLEPDAEQKLMFVFDKQTGTLVRAIDLPGRTASVPITYMYRGKQYVVFAAGSGENSEVVALSLGEGTNAPMRTTESITPSTSRRFTSSAWDGVYSAEQAVRGEAAYQAQCAACHGATLQGAAYAPTLVENAFAERWRDRSVGDLLTVLKATMPQGRAGALDDGTYADITAYLLRMNSFPSGGRQLGHDPAESSDIGFDKNR